MVRYQPKQNALLATLGLMIITGSIIVLDEGIRWPSIFSFVPVLGAMLFIGFANNGIGIGKALSFRPIRYFGLISYSCTYGINLYLQLSAQYHSTDWSWQT